MNNTYSRKFRRPMAHVSSYIVNHIYQRNPWVAVWWSAAFPGCGHIMLCKYLTGILLIAWEFFINVEAHVNEAIYYSMIGQFDAAKHVLDTRWFLLYIAVYIFAMWDCYSITIDLNKFALLADREDSSIMPFNISAFEVNYLDNRNSWVGVIWSCFNPGLGSLYIGRLPTGFYMMMWFIIVVYYAHLLPAIQASFVGDFQSARRVLDPEWLLFLPSLMGFATYDTYTQNQALNQLFKAEQSRFLTDTYKTPTFKIPVGGKETMIVIATFKHSAYLELALHLFEQKGFSKGDLLVTPLEKQPRDALSELSIVHTDGKSPYDLAFIFAMIFMLLGAIYGFIWAWGPIIWSIIGIVIGAMFGLVIDVLMGKKIFGKSKDDSDVVLMISCNPEQTNLVESILWKHRATGVSKIRNYS